MRQAQLGLLLVVTSSVCLGVALEATAQPLPSLEGKSNSLSRILRDSLRTKEIPLLNEVKRPLTSAQMLVQSTAPEVVQVTTVKANPTEKGVEVILQTTVGEQLTIANRSAGNSYIADIPNAQMRLPSGGGFAFRSQKPITGITQITVTNANANTIRVTMMGEAARPTVELFDGDEGLIFGVKSAVASSPQGQQPQTQPVEPEIESQSDEPSATDNELIEIVVTGEQETGYSVPDASTATRIKVPIRDIPQSIQVIPREVIEDRQVVRLNELADNVSGVSW